MARFDFDLFTLGAGSGGVAGARRAGSYGPKVAVCEDVRVGGTCVMRGCVPKKLLVYGSHFATDFEDAFGVGWAIEGAQQDLGGVCAAKNKELNRLEGLYHRMLRDSNVTLEAGHGVIVDPHTVEVDGRRLTAEKLLVAVGGWPEIPK